MTGISLRTARLRIRMALHLGNRPAERNKYRCLEFWQLIIWHKIHMPRPKGWGRTIFI